MSEDTLTPRNETIPGLVELATLNVGDEFQAGDTGGTVVWKVNKGSARAVDVLYDGHSKPISIAPSLKVMVRKRAEHKIDPDALSAILGSDGFGIANSYPFLGSLNFSEDDSEFEKEAGEQNDELENDGSVCFCCNSVVDSTDLSRCDDCGAFCCENCCTDNGEEGNDFKVLCENCEVFQPAEEETKEENEQVTVLDFESAPESVCIMTQDPKVIKLLPIEDAHEALLSLRELHDKDLPPAPKPIPSPTIRVIRLTADGPKTMPVMVQPPLPTCKFDLKLTPEQIRLLTFDSVKQMFYKGLYFGWTRETFFEVAKAKFPHLKAGQNYESCLAQIRLYHCALKNAGRMQ